MESTNARVRLLEVAEVAYRLSYSPEHVRRLIRGGWLPAFRLGPRSLRVDPSDLEKYVQSRRT